MTDRVKLFNVAQQRFLADVTSTISDKSNTDVYTCATWAPDRSGHGLVLGTQAGDIRCYDSARAELQWSTAGAVDGAVASLSCSAESPTLLVVGQTGAAALLNLSSGRISKRFSVSKNPVTVARLLTDSLAVVAGSGVHLYDVTAFTRVHKFTGHANPAAAICATPSGHYICTAAEGERHVAVWDATASKSGKRKHKAAATQLSLPEPVLQIAVGCPGNFSKGSLNGHFHVVAVTQGGAVWLFECTSSSAGQMKSRHWGQSSASSGQVLAAEVEGADLSGVNLVVATGSTAKPSFERIRLDKTNKAGGITEFTVGEVQVAGLVGQQAAIQPGEKNSGAQGLKERPAPVAVVDPGAGAKLANKAVGGKRSAEQDLDLDLIEAEQQEAGAAADGGISAAVEGPTFAERLAALQLQENGAQQAAQQAKQDTPAAGAPPVGPLKADSLSVLLSQALQSSDRVLLERCLTVRNEEVIRKTVIRLSSSDAALFLKAAVQRLQSAPNRGEQLSSWIRAVLISHAGSLVAMQGMQHTLAYLYQLIESRLASYQSLLALAGRLDVVLAHAQRAATADVVQSSAFDGPLVTVEVGIDDTMEVEDAFAMNGGFESNDSDDDDDRGDDEHRGNVESDVQDSDEDFHDGSDEEE